MPHTIDTGDNSIQVQVKPYKTPAASSPATVAPQANVKPPKDSRLCFLGKKANSFGFVLVSRTMTGEFDAQVTIAISSTDGLVSGQSFAGMEMDRPAGSNPLLFKFVGATYNSAANGFLVFASDETGNIGTPVLISNTAQVDLRMMHDAGVFSMSTRKTPPPGEEGDRWQTVFTDNIPVPESAFALGFGVNNLQQGGSFYFDNFSLGAGLGIAGEPEATILNALLEAADAAEDAQDKLKEKSPDFVGAAGELMTTLARLDSALSDITDAIEDGTLDPTTHGASAFALLTNARKSAATAKANCETLNPKKIKASLKLIDKAFDAGSAAAANLLGIKAKNKKQLPLAPMGP
ncbi:MAG: hypothetical protein ACKVS6_15575 [Planctomycetota bacterium]